MGALTGQTRRLLELAAPLYTFLTETTRGDALPSAEMLDAQKRMGGARHDD
jgi:hypothetical protein